MPNKYAKLRGRIVEKYGSISAFSEHLNISLTQVSKKMNGVSGFSQEDIVEWAELLEIDLAEVGTYFFD